MLDFVSLSHKLVIVNEIVVVWIIESICSNTHVTGGRYLKTRLKMTPAWKRKRRKEDERKVNRSREKKERKKEKNKEKGK